MDPLTILKIGERLVVISMSAYAAFRQASADAGADSATLAALDAKYAKAIQHEKDVLAGADATGTP
jgi:hypothetical protein